MKQKRESAYRKALRELVPLASLADFEAILAIALRGHLRHLPPSIAAWQAVTTLARHEYTDYDRLLAEGYDTDAARHFVLAEINAQLERWDCSRRLKTADLSPDRSTVPRAGR
ncbi:MAG: DUF2293 domain-containing protein [Nitratireductor sp.]|nr:DUF2293 domain-containing protein [Nitratireductor sp.]